MVPGAAPPLREFTFVLKLRLEIDPKTRAHSAGLRGWVQEVVHGPRFHFKSFAGLLSILSDFIPEK
jgi:hypothetical protein